MMKMMVVVMTMAMMVMMIEYYDGYHYNDFSVKDDQHDNSGGPE